VKALLINCTLKASPEKSNTEALAEVVASALRKEGVEAASVRAVDHSIPPGVESEMGEGDGWPGIRAQILDSEILVFATPTWLGRPSSIAQRVLERMDAMLSETDDDERPVAYNHVAGVVVTGNEDGAHHVISEVSGALADIGFTIPARPGPTGTRDRGRARTTRKPRRGTSGPTPLAGPPRRTCSRSPVRSKPSRSRRRRPNERT
jgi:multimeric flavodoxin WrbA